MVCKLEVKESCQQLENLSVAVTTITELMTCTVQCRGCEIVEAIKYINYG